MKRRINFYGGPGVGKSTLAANFFVRLKCQHLNVELVQEYVKPLVYESHHINPWQHVNTFSEQLEAEHRLLSNGVKQIVTDSPLLLQTIYARKHRCPAHEQLTEIAREFEREYPSINFLVRRTVPYSQRGRWETEHAAIEMDQIIVGTLKMFDISYHVIDLQDHSDIENCLNLL